MSLNDGLVGLWHMNNNWLDSSGSGNHGTPHGVVFDDVDKRFGLACGSFDGVDDYISVPLLNYDEVSVAGWFNRNTIDATGVDPIFGGWRWNPDEQVREGFDIRFYINSTALSFTLVTEDTGGTRIQRTIYYDIGDTCGTWVHFVATYKASTGKQRLIIDGVLRVEHTRTAGSTVVPFVAYPDMRIGYSRVNSGYFDGLIDDVAMWSRPLSDGGVSVGQTATGEVAELWNNGNGMEMDLGAKSFIPRSVTETNIPRKVVSDPKTVKVVC